jgi:hypothetical protein
MDAGFYTMPDNHFPANRFQELYNVLVGYLRKKEIPFRHTQLNLEEVHPQSRDFPPYRFYSVYLNVDLLHLKDVVLRAEERSGSGQVGLEISIQPENSNYPYFCVPILGEYDPVHTFHVFKNTEAIYEALDACFCKGNTWMKDWNS